MNNTNNILTPFVLNNGVKVPNRLVVAPMTHYASNPDGTLSDEERDFWWVARMILGYSSQQRP